MGVVYSGPRGQGEEPQQRRRRAASRLGPGMPPQNTGAWGRGGVRGIPAVLPDTPAARHTEGWLLQHCLHGRLWAASKRAAAGCAAQAPATCRGPSQA